MASRFSKIALILALICSVGWHWAVLQSVAWVGMVVSYSQSASFRQALVKTFDGNEPCGICKFVAEGKKSQNKQEILKPGYKLELFAPRHFLSLQPISRYPLVVSPLDKPIQRPESPPTPPPRVA